MEHTCSKHGDTIKAYTVLAVRNDCLGTGAVLFIFLFHRLDHLMSTQASKISSMLLLARHNLDSVGFHFMLSPATCLHPFSSCSTVFFTFYSISFLLSLFLSIFPLSLNLPIILSVVYITDRDFTIFISLLL